MTPPPAKKPIEAPAIILRREFGPADIGRAFKNRGILVAAGITLLDTNNMPTKQRFNYFITPQDTRLLADDPGHFGAFIEDLERISRLYKVFGHNGILLEGEEDIIGAAEHNPEKLESWHMLPLQILSGTTYMVSAGGNSIRHNPRGLYYNAESAFGQRHNKKSRLKGSFIETSADGHHQYWSPKRWHVDPCHAITTCFDSGRHVLRDIKEQGSSRPGRAELCPPRRRFNNVFDKLGLF